MSKNYIKFQNQGTIEQHLMLLNEMANSVGYSDENGYFSKKAIAEIGINAYIITSGGKIGEDILDIISDTAIKEEDNSPLQNAKLRMHILRILGLVSTDYNSELYAITDLGKKVLERVFPASHTEAPDYSLLRETFMGISSSSEVYDYNVDFNSYLGYGICYAFSCLDYKISTHELPLITTYDINEIREFVKTVKRFRKTGKKIPKSHEHYPKTQKGTALNQVSNLTRTINQILRICDIIKQKTVDDYYECTEFGKLYVDSVKKIMENESFKLWTPQLFRKEKLLKQKELCIIGYNNMLKKGGFEVEKTDENTVFSPYQLIPETCVNWFLEKDIRKPPISMIPKVQVINSQISGHELRLKPTFFTHNEYERFIKTHINKSNLISEIITERDKGTDKEVFINRLCETYKKSDKSVFYPFIRLLFKTMGIVSHRGAGRIDELFEYNNVKIPAEIKSPSETKTYNMKGARQALENKINVYKVPQDLNYATLLIGYNHPSSTNEIQDFMDAVFEELKIKIIAFDFHTIVTMCVNTVWDKQRVNFEDLFRKYGIAEV